MNGSMTNDACLIAGSAWGAAAATTAAPLLSLCARPICELHIDLLSNWPVSSLHILIISSLISSSSSHQDAPYGSLYCCGLISFCYGIFVNLSKNKHRPWPVVNIDLCDMIWRALAACRSYVAFEPSNGKQITLDSMHIFYSTGNLIPGCSQGKIC